MFCYVYVFSLPGDVGCYSKRKRGGSGERKQEIPADVKLLFKTVSKNSLSGEQRMRGKARPVLLFVFMGCYLHMQVLLCLGAASSCTQPPQFYNSDELIVCCKHLLFLLPLRLIRLFRSPLYSRFLSLLRPLRHTRPLQPFVNWPGVDLPIILPPTLCVLLILQMPRQDFL